MASFKSLRAPNDRFTTDGMLGVDDRFLDELLGALIEDDRDDPLLAPWRRGHRVAIRSAFGH